MVKMNWMITTELTGLSLKEFEKEWERLIEAHFEMIVNESSVDFFPEEADSWDGFENIIYWLDILLESIDVLERDGCYDMFLLAQVRYHLFAKKVDNTVELSYIEKENERIEWKETVSWQEYTQAIYDAVDEFREYIKKTNRKLLKAKWINQIKY